MNQRDGFGSGFLAGTIVGGVVGGLLGALIASARDNESDLREVEPRMNTSLSDAKNSKAKRRQIRASSSDATIEAARRSLEDKIAQLNETIDEVRLTLGNVNGNPPEGNTEQSLTIDP